MTEESLFARALEKPAAERAAYLQEACAGDAALRERVEVLLRAHDNPASFLGSPPPGLGASTVGMSRNPGVDDASEERPTRVGPGIRIGPYKLLEAIGEGGMGTVYQAEQTAPVRRMVALKVIKAGMDSRQVMARFEAERQALALMDHPHIAKVLDAGATEHGRPYFVMELVKGLPITRYCDEQRLTPRKRLALFIPVCQAVQHAHQKGLIHRDIKPSNVLVGLYDGVPIPKVIDFGVAKATGQRLTEATLFTGFGTVVGTPEYMSPEQAQLDNVDIDTRSDIYSLGVLLYELLTGTTPIDRRRLNNAAILEVLRIVREDDPPQPSTRLSSTEELPSIAANRNLEPRTLTGLVRGELDWIVMKALDKNRARRYETANGLAADLTRYLADEPVSAGPPSAAYRFRKFARRNRRALAVTMILTVATLVAVGATAASIGWALNDRATRQMAVEQEASRAFDEADRWMDQEDWHRAEQAVLRGEGVLAGVGRDEIRARMRRLKRQISMMLDLQRIDFLALDLKSDWLEVDTLDNGYARAFADFGIDVVNLPVEEAAVRLRSEGRITAALIRALDNWSSLDSPKTRERLPKLRAIAGLGDDDPWRREIREALERRDGDGLEKLAGSPDLRRQSRDNLAFLEHSLEATGRSDLALAVRRVLQRNHPGDFMANYWLAYRLFWASPSDATEVASFARAAVALRPGTSAAQLLLAIALQRAGKLDEALHHHDRAIELAPENPFAYHDRGWTLHLMGRDEEAVASNRKAIELWDQDYFAFGNMAVSLKSLNRIEESISAHKMCARYQSNPVQTYLDMGNTLRENGRFEEARASYQRAAELDPESNRAPLEIANTLRLEGKLDEAVVMFKDAIRRDPNLAIAYNDLGRTLSRQGKLDEAVANHEKAIELDPKNGWSHLSLGLIRTAQKRLTEADHHYQRAIELDPSIPQFHFHRGWNWYLQGNDAQTWSCLRAAIRLARNPTVPFHSSLHRSFNDRAWKLATDANATARRPALAVELAAEAVRLDSANGFNWNTLGVARYRNGEFKAAIHALNTSMERFAGSNESFNQFFLAMSHWRLGDPDEARTCYDRAVAWMDANRPNDPELIRFRTESRTLLGFETETMPTGPEAFARCP